MAVYLPRVRAGQATLPPSGAVAGVIARTDVEHGVWAPPAGSAVALEVDGLAWEPDRQDIEVFTAEGINCLRTSPSSGPVVWGARTLAGVEGDTTEWRYVNVRRLALFLEESIVQGTSWTVFEPNDEPLWARVRSAVESFLIGLWRDGAFQGDRPDDAYFVRCDRSTMTQDDVENGRLVLVVGFAPIRPAEFVILRICLEAA